MPLPVATEPSVGSPSEIVRDPPHWAFWKGLLVAVILEIPAISAAIFLLPRMGLGASTPPMLVVRMTSLFAGLPALLTGAGIGRLVAYESVKRGRRSAIARGAGVHALAGVLLAFIAALPHGYLPASSFQWASLVLVGGAAGALCGAAIGMGCSGAPPRQVTEMMSLVRHPGLTLRQLIDTEDLGRIGAAVRSRATQMFDGLLDPAAPRPRESAEGDRDLERPSEVEVTPSARADEGAAREGATEEGATGGPQG